MNRSDESVIYWNENVTLRRFLIVSSLLLFWIGSDLVLHRLAHQGIDEFDFWSKVETYVGFPISRTFYEWLPADSWRLHLYTAYSLPGLGLISLILLDRLVNQGKTRLPWGITACGGLFIVGGAVLDMAVTVAHSPNLEMEGNPYVRILLDSQHSLGFVYARAIHTVALHHLVLWNLDRLPAASTDYCRHDLVLVPDVMGGLSEGGNGRGTSHHSAMAVPDPDV